MELPLRSELSKKTPGIGKRGSYNPACDACRRRKSKCDGIEPICHRCQSSGREMECTWNKVHARKHRSVQIVDDADTITEKLRNLLTEYWNYADLLERLLDQCPNTHHSHFGVDFRVSRPIDRDNLISSSIHIENADFDFTSMTEENEALDDLDDPTKEIRLQTQRLMLEEGGSIHHYGITAPFRFKRFDPSLQPSRFPVITQNPQATCVLTSEKFYDSYLDWSRYLPSEVPLDRMSHDKALDLLFKFFTSFCLRIIPDLFLRDMYRELSVPLSQERPKTSHYSPMLHNALAALALTFLDDPKFRDLKTRQCYIDKAKTFMEAECQHPSISVVQALSFLGSFYASQGEQVLGFLYFGQSTRVAQALGLNIDCSDAVRLGIIEESDRVDRNWTNWTTFANDVCWSLYLGRPFGISLPEPDFPMPYVDTELDRMPWKYDSSNSSPQPNYFTKTFEATCELFIIARCILDVINQLNKANARPRLIHEQIHNLDMRLKGWHSSLASELNITPKSRSAATPHNLCLHLSYWWLVILLHRPFHRNACSISKPGEDIGHPKLCRHSAENIMDLLATWQELYGLRYCPITLIQIAFSAGTVYLLIAIQACSGVRVAQKELRYSLDQQRLILQHLTEIGRSWPGATKIAEILMRLTQDRLMPLLERRKIHVRNHEIFQGAQLGDESMFSLPLSFSQCSEDSVEVHRRTQNKGKEPLTLHTPIIPGKTGISPAQDLTSPMSTRHLPREKSAVRQSTSLESSSPSSFVYIRADAIASSSPTTSPGVPFSPNPSRSFDGPHWRGSPPEDYYDVAGLHLDFQQAGSLDSEQGVSTPGSPAFGGFAGMLGGRTITPAPFWDPFSTEGSVMDDTAYTAMSSSSTPGLPLLKQPTADHETDDNRMYLTTSEAANVGMDTDACMYDLAQWVNLVSREFS